MKIFTKLTSFVVLLAAFTLSSCEKEELELNVVSVNGVEVTLIPIGGGETQSFTMSTPYTGEDGKTFGELKQEDITLKANTTYNATITYFSNKTGTRVVQNDNIRKEEAVYAVAFEKGSNNTQDFTAELTVAATDKKADGTPLGLLATFTTGKAGVETLYIDLNANKTKGKSYMAGTVFNATYFVNVQP